MSLDAVATGERSAPEGQENGKIAAVGHVRLVRYALKQRTSRAGMSKQKIEVCSRAAAA